MRRETHLRLWTRLLEGRILGVVDSNGSADSVYTGTEEWYHADHFPTVYHCRWRWSICNNIEWWSCPRDYEIATIRQHLEKRYSVPFKVDGSVDVEKIKARVAFYTLPEYLHTTPNTRKKAA